ncbi:Hypothetical predicted protein [Cloeon dipterum]|uniref:BTB domain-containing protein n=1 Tax=Cloeon dipterum TaxID=197152 RepID=A0A8S1CHZ8_9INSE|nr:Hypothetical predicted protein [Cloeon dipterum]
MQLGFYTEEEFYDCSFLVGKDDDIEIFKCHKLVLAAQSQVFAKMLFGSFSEAHQSRDEPIAFNDCTPSTFDLAMRFIYGNVQEFSTIPVACDVYKFAHKWQFQNLKQAAMNTLRESKPDEVLMVYEMHALLGDDEEKNHCKKFIIKNTSEVLSSPSWIHASSSTVDEIFKEPVLKVTSERELFDALVRWDDTEYESSDVQVNCDSPRSRTLFQLDTEQVYIESINLDCFIMEENKGREANLICSVTEHKSGKQVAVVKFKGLIDNDLEGDFASWMKQLEAASKKEAANSKKQQPVDCGKSYQINNDRLAWYTESRFYDCSFSVGRENPKIFKCHRIVLALESEVFEKMLFGSFAEGRKMKDDAIVFDDSTLPETFDQVMRFIYGYEISLEEAAVEVLRKTVKADQILMVYEMHRFFGDVKEEEFYRQKIKNEIGKVLSSASWIQATPSTVLDIFKEKVLTVSEKELFDALVRWGRANETSAAHLRAKIDSALKEIRFMSMDAEDFAKLSSDNAEIFSVEERQNSGKQLAIEKFKGNIGPETTGVTFLMPVLLENNTQYAVSIQYFNKNPLRSKKYVYEANPSAADGMSSELMMEQQQPHELQNGARILSINGQTIVVNGVKMDSGVSGGQLFSVLEHCQPQEEAAVVQQTELDGPEGGLLVYFDDESSELQSVQISADQAAALGLDGNTLLAPEPPPLALQQQQQMEKTPPPAPPPCKPVTLSIFLPQTKQVAPPRPQPVQIVPKLPATSLLTVQPETRVVRTAIGRADKVIPRILATPTAAPPLVPFSKSVLKAKPIAVRPVGSNENPIKLVQHGQTYHSMQPLNQEQLKQISSVLQQKQIETAPNTKIVYRVVMPGATDCEKVATADKPLPRKRGRPSKVKKASDDEEYNEPDITKGEKEERKKLIPRTRSGRLSRPPRHMVKDYKRIHHLDFAEPDLDDSDGGYSDYQISDSEVGAPQIIDPQMSENNSPNTLAEVQRAPKKYDSKFRCPTCDKIYLGTKRLTQHFQQYPDHGSVDCVPVQLPSAKETMKKKKPSRPLRKPPLQETKNKIRNILSKCEPHEVAEIAGSVVAQSVDLWHLLLLKVAAKDNSGTRTEAVLREVDQLLEKAKHALQSTVLNHHQTDQFADATEINVANSAAAAALNIAPGPLKVDRLEDARICWQPEIVEKEATPPQLPPLPEQVRTELSSLGDATVGSDTDMLVDSVPSFELTADLKLDKPLDGTLLSDTMDEIVTAGLNSLVGGKEDIEGFPPATVFDGQTLDMAIKAGWDSLADHHALDQTALDGATPVVDFDDISEEFNRNTQAQC